MKGRDTFTSFEIETLYKLLRCKDEADSCEQKKIRAEMRKIGFYITDFDEKMNSDDFNALIANGRIHISDKLTKVFDDNHKLMAHIVVPQNNMEYSDFSENKNNIGGGTNYVKRGPEPWINDDCEYIILGSFPGDISIKSKAYYQNKNKNSFWKLMHALFGNGDDSKEFLLSHHVALWDCLALCNRKGSLDSNISGGEVPNNIIDLLRKYPNIKKIILNGYGKTRKCFAKYFKDLYKQHKYDIVAVPSSSNTLSMFFHDKLEIWRKEFEIV